MRIRRTVKMAVCNGYDKLQQPMQNMRLCVHWECLVSAFLVIADGGPEQHIRGAVRSITSEDYYPPGLHMPWPAISYRL
jgi:hypothetical protein